MPDRRELEANVGASRSTDEERHRADAHRYAEQATRAARDHQGRLRALEDVFGPAVRAAAEEHLERLTESSGEAIYSLERVVAAGDADRAALRDELVHVRAVLTNTLAELGRAIALPETMIGGADRYFRTTRRARPTWLRHAEKELVEIRRARRDAGAVVEEPF